MFPNTQARSRRATPHTDSLRINWEPSFSNTDRPRVRNKLDSDCLSELRITFLVVNNG